MLRSSALCSQFALSGTGLDQKNHPHHHGLRCSESCCEIAADRPVDSFVPWLQTWGEEGSVQMMMMMMMMMMLMLLMMMMLMLLMMMMMTTTTTTTTTTAMMVMTMVVVVVAVMMIMVIARVRIKLLKWSPFIRACSVNLWNKMGHDCHQDKTTIVIKIKQHPWTYQ